MWQVDTTTKAAQHVKDRRFMTEVNSQTPLANLHVPPTYSTLEIQTPPSTVSASHFDSGKEGVDQIPPEILLEIGSIYSFGEQKYGRDNWKKGMAWHRVYGSALRHIFKFWRGIDIDDESGLHHLDHAIWNLITLRYYQMHKLGEDSRGAN